MRILVVDDDAVSRHEIAETLRQEGYEVVAAADGREALEIFLRGECQLVITDWMMPEVSGIHLCRAIRLGIRGLAPYILIVSSLSDPRDVQLAISAGANDFLSKPLDRQALLDRVQTGERALAACRLNAVQLSSMR
jgi:putative two-component system response regulator